MILRNSWQDEKFELSMPINSIPVMYQWYEIMEVPADD